MQRLTFVSLVAIALFLLLITGQSVEFHLTNLTWVDDGFYYLGYARSLSLGLGPTFDGIVVTNGVQPLWALMLIALAQVENDPEGLMRLAMLVAVALAVGSVFAMNSVLKRFFAPPLLSVVIVFYLALIANPQLILSGMEIAANLATLTLALAAILRVRMVAVQPTLIAGILVGLACLARVDNIILMPAFVIVLLWSNGTLRSSISATRWKDAIRSSMWLLIPAIILFGGYIVFNIAVFQRALPISGEVKSLVQAYSADALGGRFSLAYVLETTHAAAEQYIAIVNTYLTMLLAGFSQVTLFTRLALALIMGVLILAVIRRRGSSYSFSLRGSSLGVLVWVLVTGNVLFHTWALFFQLGKHNAGVLNWYYVPEYLLITVGFGFLLHGIARLVAEQPLRFYRLVTVWLVMSITFSVGVFLWHLRRPAGVQPLLTHYRVTQWANAHLPAGDIWGSFNAGVVGYFSEATVINLDGLMNDKEILEIVNGRGSLIDYIQRHDIAWILDYTYADWSRSNPADFQSIPISRLEVVYEQRFENYGFEPSTFYVFRVVR